MTEFKYIFKGINNFNSKNKKDYNEYKFFFKPGLIWLSLFLIFQKNSLIYSNYDLN